jgi:hypothetical protein
MRVGGVALPGAVLFAEAALLVHRSGNGDAAYRRDSLQTALIEAILGVLVVLAVGRGARQRLEGLAVAIPLAVIGYLGLALTGFNG